MYSNKKLKKKTKPRCLKRETKRRGLFGEGSISAGFESLVRFRHAKLKAFLGRELMNKHAKIIQHKIVQKMKPRTCTLMAERLRFKF